jgi:hypothetical protein
MEASVCVEGGMDERPTSNPQFMVSQKAVFVNNSP